MRWIRKKGNMTQQARLRRKTLALAGLVLLSTGLPGWTARAQTAEAPAPLPAAAPGDAERIVVTRDGGMYRGTVVELVPQDHLTLKLATGELRRLAWGDIQSQANVAPVAPAPPAGYAAPPAGYATPPGYMPQPVPPAPGVLVRIDSPNPRTQLYRSAGTSDIAGMAAQGYFVGRVEHWELVCNGTCETRVDPFSRYQIRGSNMPVSAAFELPGGRPQVDLRVQPGSIGRRVGGWVGLTLGVLALSTGASLLVTAAITTGFQEPGTSGYSAALLRSQNLKVAGGVTLGLGAAGLATGIALIVTSKTKVWVDGDTRVAGVYLRGPQGPILSTRGLLF